MNQDLWDRIRAAIGRSGQEDGRVDARDALDAAWRDCPESEHALRCVIGHYVADLQDEPAAELRWDEIALVEHALADPAQWAVLGIADPAGMLASLHLNLGDDHLRAGDPTTARRLLALAEQGLAALGDDGYGAMIRRGVAGLRERWHDS